jgi:hypothetical protein
LVVLAGLLAGLVLGLGIVAALLVWRRPVLGAAAAGQVVGAPVLGSLEIDPKTGGVRGLPQLYTRLVRRSDCVVFLTGIGSSEDDVPLVADGLRGLARHSLSAEPNAPANSGLTVVEEPGADDLLSRPGSSLTLLLVSVGTPESSLRREAELQAADNAGVVFVRHAGTASKRRLGLQRRGRVGS